MIQDEKASLKSKVRLAKNWGDWLIKCNMIQDEKASLKSKVRLAKNWGELG